jgi:chromatin structure-remodeling complex subunit RSC1/2
MSGTHITAPLPSPMASQNPGPMQTYGQQFTPSRPSASPAPTPLLQHHNSSYSSHGSASHSALPQTPLYPPQQTYNNYPTSGTTPMAQHANPIATYNHYQNVNTAPRHTPQPSTSHSTHANAYNPPRQSEVYTLADTANLALPRDLRSRFHQDSAGRVIFFTAPPLDVKPVPEEKQTLGHSLRYLADKARSREADSKKRKARAEELESEATARSKRMKADDEGNKQWISDQKLKALNVWCEGMDKGTDELYKQMYGENWKEMRDLDLYKLAVRQEETFHKQKEIEKLQRETTKETDIGASGFKWV